MEYAQVHSQKHKRERGRVVEMKNKNKTEKSYTRTSLATLRSQVAIFSWIQQKEAPLDT